MNLGEDSKQHVWKEAAVHQPEWLFLCGDNIYMDWGLTLRRPRKWDPKKFTNEMMARYSKQFAIPSFHNLVASIPAGQVVGTWDDHDFAWNNCHGADAKYQMSEKRLIARVLFHHYFTNLNQRPLPTTLPQVSFEQVPTLPGYTKDIYRAFDLGPLRVLVCDGRFYREDEDTVNGPPALLGANQEQWLLGELAIAGRRFLLLTGSPMTEAEDQSWDYFTDFYKNRFLPATNGKTVVFVAGDVHENRLPIHPLGVPVEIITSGAALGFFFPKRNFGVLDVSNTELRVFLYSDGKIEFTGVLNLNTGKFKNSAVVMKLVPKVLPSVASIRAQRNIAAKKIKSLR